MMRRHSPYNYAFNNPVFFMDPDGMSPQIPMVSDGYVSRAANTISGSVEFSGTFDAASTGGSESKTEAVGLNANISAPTLSKQNDVAGSGMAIGNDGVEDISGGNQSTPGSKWYKNVFQSTLQHRFKNNFSFNDAVWHYRLGGGEPVNVNTNSLNFDFLSVKDFDNTELSYQGHPLIYARLSDISNFVNNTNQALIYGTVGVVYLGGNNIMVLPDLYDFDVKFEPTLRGISRDLATMLGQMYNGGGTPYNIQFIGTTKIKN